MRILNRLFQKFAALLILGLFFCVHLRAQINRARNKTIVAYDNNYQRASAGANHSIEIRNGVLWAYGDNTYGQLGDGTKTERKIPVAIGNSESNNWVTVSCGENHTLAIKADGTLWAWGDNTFGQLGDSAFSSSSVPIEIGRTFNWICVDAGRDHSLAIRSDGTLWSWGKNSNGQLGIGATTNRFRLTQVGINNHWVSISAGENHAMGVQSDGTLWVWGNNSFGQIGDGTSTQRLNPVKIGTKLNWTLVSAGYGHSTGLQADGTLWTWGDNKYGQLGHGDVSNKNNPVRVGTDRVWKALSAGSYGTFALRCDGTLWAAGFNNVGQLGDGTTNSRNNLVQVNSSTNNWVSIQSGGSHSLALKADGSLNGWGKNNNGQLGDSTNTDKTTAIKISNTLNWVGFSTGINHTMAIRSDGTLWGWGGNQMLNDSVMGNTFNPIQIGSDNIWIGVVTYVNHHLAIKADGTLWSWGENTYGQLGDGTNINKRFPVQVGTDNNWSHVSLGDSQTIALRFDGTLWRWGSNFFWQLGDSVLKGWNYPRQMGTSTDWVSTSTGADFSIVLNARGDLFSWGVGFLGQTGDGTTATRHDIHQIANGHYVKISSGPQHTLGLRSDGKIWAWGRCDVGQVGDGFAINRHMPVQIYDVGNTWVSMSAGSKSTMLIAADGKIWSCGLNKQGQMGNRENYNLLSPALNTHQKNVISVSICQVHSGIMKPNRLTICMAGTNFNGQLGIDEGFKNSDILVTNFGCDPEYSLKIFTDTTFPVSLCVGSTLKIPFALIGSYLSELKYTAQLSDSLGQFNNATNLGSKSSIDSDTIDALIPLTIPSGQTYRIRVVASDTLVPSIDNGKDIRIHRLPATLVLTNGKSGFCENGFFILEAEEQGNFYQWQKNLVDIDSANKQTYKVDSPGNYKVRIKNQFGCLDSSIAFQLSAFPQVNITEQPKDQTVNIGKQATFSAAAANLNITFQWQLLVAGTFINLTNAGPYSGAKSYKLSIANVLNSMDGNAYRCLITTSEGCFTPSDSAILNINKVGIFDMTTSGDLQLYPNPVIDQLTIKSGKLIGSHYVLADIFGKTLLSGKLNDEITILPASHLAKGIYFLNIDGNKTTTFKVVKY